MSTEIIPTAIEMAPEGAHGVPSARGETTTSHSPPPSPPPPPSLELDSRNGHPPHAPSIVPPHSPPHHHRMVMPSGATAGAASPLYRPKIRSHSFGQQQISLTPSSSGGWGFFPSSPYAVRSVPASPVGARATSRNLSAPCAPRLPVFPPPEHSDQRKAMEAVATAERQRAKEMEAKEENLSAEELRAILKRERHRMGRIAGELASVRYLTGHYQLEAEMCEEGRINCLMRRMDLLQQEKGRIIVELEREEEMLTNTLQKKLDQVRREKAVLEQQIEREKMSHATLQQKLGSIQENQQAITESLEEEDEMEEE